MANFKDDASVPYLFNPLTKEELEAANKLRDFMEKHKDEMPPLSVRGMIHYLAMQLGDAMDVWQAEMTKQKIEQGQKVSHETVRIMLAANYAQYFAFIAAHKERLADSGLILQTASHILQNLYGGSK